MHFGGYREKVICHWISENFGKLKNFRLLFSDSDDRSAFANAEASASASTGALTLGPVIVPQGRNFKFLFYI